MEANPIPMHPVAVAAGQVSGVLAGVAEVPLWSLGPGEAGETLRVLTAARAQLEELTARVLLHAETAETGLDAGATSTTNWWAHATRITRAEAHRTRRLASGLERHGAVREALASGTVVAEQAWVICEAVGALPDDVEDWVVPAAVGFMLGQAEEHDAKALRVLGRRLLEVVDPDAADVEEARTLEQEEAEAARAASFTISDDGHGRCHGRFTLPSLQGQMLHRHLTAIALAETSKPHGAPDDGEAVAKVDADDVSRPPLLGRHRMGEALMTYIETRPENTLTSSGGIPATVVVTMELETLTGGLKAASLDTGGRISAGEARRLACRAGIIPAVLDGASVVLDLGRRRRFHSPAQRIAMQLRDKGCTAEGCDAPPGLCQAHHDTPWSRGGPTTVAEGRLLCPKHHRRIHDPGYQHHLDKHGKVRFTRRT